MITILSPCPALFPFLPFPANDFEWLIIYYSPASPLQTLAQPSPLNWLAFLNSPMSVSCLHLSLEILLLKVTESVDLFSVLYPAHIGSVWYFYPFSSLLVFITHTNLVLFPSTGSLICIANFLLVCNRQRRLDCTEWNSNTVIWYIGDCSWLSREIQSCLYNRWKKEYVWNPEHPQGAFLDTLLFRG